MKAAAFDYVRAREVQEAVRLLAEGGGQAKLLAGGQSLGPMLNLRLVRVGLLVDIRRIAALTGVEEVGGRVRYGALVTHAALEDGTVPDAAGGLLQEVAGGIAYRAVRTRGTLGGSLVHADPAADWVSAFTALDAELHLHGPNGARRVRLTEAMRGAFSMDVEEEEILTAVEVPKLSPVARWGFHKINRKVGEFASAIGVALHDPKQGLSRVVCGAVEGVPRHLDEVAAALAAEGPTGARGQVPAAVARALPDMDEVDLHLHIVAVQRALDRMVPA